MEYLLMTLVIFGALVLVGYPLANPRRYTMRKFITMGDPQHEHRCRELRHEGWPGIPGHQRAFAVIVRRISRR